MNGFGRLGTQFGRLGVVQPSGSTPATSEEIELAHYDDDGSLVILTDDDSGAYLAHG